MCDKSCLNNTAGFQPCICVKDLSVSTQGYLKIKQPDEYEAPFGFPQIIFVSQIDGDPDAGKVLNMANLSVGYCIKLAPCCTSKIAIDNSTALINFLAQKINPNNAPQWLQVQKMLTGNFSCPNNCC